MSPIDNEHSLKWLKKMIADPWSMGGGVKGRRKRIAPLLRRAFKDGAAVA
jgi:hypothetical protein